MALDDLVRKGVAIAKKQTGALQVEITLRRWTSLDIHGDIQAVDNSTWDVLFERKVKKFKAEEGVEISSRGKVTFIEPVPPVSPAVADRQEPIDPMDVVILDGQEWPVLSAEGLGDPDISGRPYLLEVYLG